MELGHLDICLTVENVNRSLEFYTKLGFQKDEGDLQAGWAVVQKDGVRFGLYEPRACGGKLKHITLNFRGGNISELTQSLSSSGIKFDGEVKVNGDGSGCANIKDPDGYHLFFDTAPGEKPKN